ncbi:MAG: SLC13 family permease, partial [Bacteroidota bacterium]
GIPFAVIMIAAIYFVLVKWMYPNGIKNMDDSTALIDEEIAKLGKMSKEEKWVLVVFFAAIFLWIFRTLLNKYIPILDLSDVGISMLAAFALFAIPMKFKEGKFPLDWKDTQKLPWGILILFGGGLALASGLSQVGIIDIIGETVAKNGTLSNITVASILIVVMLFMTELMSNVALVAIFAPVISGIALGMDASMMHFLIPVTLASSCAFMLPMATPPNAIVFASGHIKIYQMARAGVFLNITAIILLIVFTQFYIPLLFD